MLTSLAVRAAIEFHDRTGQLVAPLDDCENVLDRSLAATFQDNALRA